MPFVDIIIFFLIFLPGLVCAIIGLPMLIVGVKSRADMTVLLACFLVAVSITCFITLAWWC